MRQSHRLGASGEERNKSRDRDAYHLVKEKARIKYGFEGRKRGVGRFQKRKNRTRNGQFALKRGRAETGHEIG